MPLIFLGKYDTPVLKFTTVIPKKLVTFRGKLATFREIKLISFIRRNKVAHKKVQYLPRYTHIPYTEAKLHN